MEIINQIILVTSIILLASVSGFILEKSGTMAIGIESILTISAFSFVAINHSTSNIYVSIILALLVGGITSVFMQVLITCFKSNQALIAIGMNITIPMLLFLISLQTSPNKLGYLIPNIMSWMKNGYNTLFFLFLAISIIVILILSVFIFKTKFGLTLNAIGENPYVIQASGKNIYLVKMKLAFLSGVIAGIGGIFVSFFYMIWTNGNYYDGSMAASGLGFIALGVIILSRWEYKHFLWITPIMGILIGLFYNFLYIWNTNVSLLIFLKCVPYIIPMVILPFNSNNQNVPSQLGVIFNKNKRE